MAQKPSKTTVTKLPKDGSSNCNYRDGSIPMGPASAYEHSYRRWIISFPTRTAMWGVPFSDTTKLSWIKWIIINSHIVDSKYHSIIFYPGTRAAPAFWHPQDAERPERAAGHRRPAKVEHGVRIAHGQDGRWDEDPPGHSRKSPGCLSFRNFIGGVAYVMLCDTDLTRLLGAARLD